MNKLGEFVNENKPKTVKGWIFFWLGIAVIMFALVFFFWQVSKVVASDGEVVAETSKVQQQSMSVSSSDSESTNKPMLKSVSFMTQKSSSNDINWGLIIALIIGVSLISYFIYKNKDSSV
jgi:hypothetical protein